jgi:hypothetical protein
MTIILSAQNLDPMQWPEAVTFSVFLLAGAWVLTSLFKNIFK